MIPFTSAHNFYRAIRWLKVNAKGDCTILVQTPGYLLRGGWTYRPFMRRDLEAM